MPKVYLRATGINRFEWVDNPENATADAKEAMEVTLKQFKDAELVQAPKKTLEHQPGWIISREVITSETSICPLCGGQRKPKGMLPEQFAAIVEHNRRHGNWPLCKCAAQSFMLEALQGNGWSAETFDLRFATENEAAEYAQDLNRRWNLTQPIRVQPSTDPVNCKFIGGLGNKHLEKL